MNDIWTYIGLALYALSLVAVFLFVFRYLRSKNASVKTVSAKVVAKYTRNNLSKIYGPVTHPAVHYVIFQVNKRTCLFRVSEFTYCGIKVNDIGTLKYKEKKLVSFD